MYKKIMKSKDRRSLISSLVVFFKKNKKKLLNLNEFCTKDTQYWTKKDWEQSLNYLKKFENNNMAAFKNKRKPKGVVFIILSYNEPLLLSIIPILNALIAGNRVIVKPSSKAWDVWNVIWNDSGIVKDHNLMLETISGDDVRVFENCVKRANAVYFFGGHAVAKKIYKICAKNFVEFYPEIETSDCKVLDIENNKKFNISKDVSLTLRESFSHAGQICQRIQGIIVVGETIYDEYIKLLEEEFNKLKNKKNIYVSDKFKPNKEYLKSVLCDIKKARPEKVQRYKRGLPILVINPKKESIFIKNAYFLPILWVLKVESKEELLSFLNERSYYLGLNIMSDNELVIRNIIDNTNFSRYTINTSHTKIRINEGWGGNWPSGFSGYKKWIEHFTNPFDKITNLS